MPSRAALACALVLLAASAACAGEVHVAVAANFAKTARELGEAFHEAHGDTVVASEGSTGKLYAQIVNGAPYEVFLSADAERPRRLVEEGHAIADTRFPYALGRLVLWSPDPARVKDASTLRGEFRHLAIANPELAPYGAAARDVLRALGLWDALQPRLVRGEDVGQTYQFVATGNAELGFVALSQVRAGAAGSHWLVPAEHHAPLEQQAVLLRAGEGDAAARAFLAFLQGGAARRILEAAGYALPPAPSQ